MKHDGAGREAHAPRNRFGRVLAVLSPRRRKSRADLNATPGACLSEVTLSEVGLQPLQLPDQKLDDLHRADRESPAELDGGLFGDGKVLFGTDEGAALDSFGHASREVDAQGPVPPYTCSAARHERDRSYASLAGKLERDVSPMPHYRPEGSPTPPPLPSSVDINKLVLEIPPVTTAPPAAWHRKRTGPPPPLTIEPPIHSRSPSDAYSAYSTFAAPDSPYEYYSFNIPVPNMPSPLWTSSQKDSFASNPPDGSRSIRSSHSNTPPHRSASPHSPTSVPSMSRSNSGAQTESMSPLPRTPTYSPTGSHSPTESHSSMQSQKVPIESTTFVCLGPLPDHVPTPTPGQFRTESRSVPRVLVPEARRGRSLTTSSEDAMSPVVLQDPLLHVSNPLPPYQNAVNPTFTREHSAHAADRVLEGGGDVAVQRQRRPSADSLGSNFTVEEEERIQAQIVKNLSMLGKERVVGGNDIVHIPQISARRYSWEQ